MSFVSLAYLLFLAGACLLYYILPKITQPFWLLACSYLFYLYEAENAKLVWVLLGATGVTYVTGLVLDFLRDKKVWTKRVFLAVAIVLCFGCLTYYKYWNFFGSLFGGSGFQPVKMIVPLGISYFLFMAVGYLIDVYRGKIRAERNVLYYALFVSFFPCLVAGPIERADQMLPQFRQPVTFDYNRVTGGLFRILWGSFKKLVLANTLYNILKAVFTHLDQYSGPVLLLAALLFSYYLYCDFSALSDIAIGSGAVFGFEIMENFKRPLAACSFTDLWRRWHISLSSWFRDYLYFPLGGNRKGKLRACINQVIVFAVSGLWHGASMGYLVWGLLNGVYLFAGKETLAVREKLAAHNPFYRWAPLKKFFQASVTYLLFTSCIVFFATEVFVQKGGDPFADAMYLYAHLFTGWEMVVSQTTVFWEKLVAIGFTSVTTWVLLGSFVIVEGLECAGEPMHLFVRKIPFFLRWPLYYALILMIGFFGQFGLSAFVYGNF